MTDRIAMAWGAAIVAVGLLNIADVLPDWTTIAAILTLPLVASWRCAGTRCGTKSS
ncbi:hypothetical protein [Croceicoccus sp. BE223]|uniref:hypothetical protein n=1 Tax=Croceicoccus sp. BE223 TaxID=2817716 RepID=UPI00285D336F|nr:hypothetical protein [Croceicoccus sp. BE223]MDR7100912.1 hypothetical protein [Croceicoccus sp. BE223]